MAGRKPPTFTLRPSPLGTEEFYHQTNTENFRLTIDSIAEYVDNYIGGDQPVYNGTRVVSGGRVIWQQDLDFVITSAVYYINGVRYESDEQSVTLADADPTNPRFDRFYLDTSLSGGAITGTPASDPLAPSVDPETQIRLTIAEVAAGATQPSNIVGEIIYDENVQVAGGEWDTSSTNAPAVDFDATDDPSINTKYIKTTRTESGNTLIFQHDTPVDVSQYEFLVMDVKQPATFGQDVYLQLFLTKTGVASFLSSVNLRNGMYGFESGVEGYQTVAIDLSAFATASGVPLNDLQPDTLTIVITGGATFYQWKFDNIRLQGGLEPQSQPYEFYTHKNTLWVDGNGSNEIGRKGRLDKPFRTIAEAEANALSGDTIIVMPGTYTESNLGKDGVTYRIESGATLKTSGAVNLFTDGGTEKTLRIDCKGKLETDNGTILNIGNANTVAYVYADEIVQNDFGATRHVFLINNGTLYLTYNYAFCNADDYFFINGSSCTAYVHSTGYTDVRTQIVSVSGTASKAYYVGNFEASNSSNNFENSFGARGAGTYLKIKSNYFDSNNSGATYNGTFDIRDGATIDFEGYMRVSNANWDPLDVDRTNGGGSRLILRNAHIIYEDVNSSRPVIRLNQATSRCEIYDSIIENRNQLANSHGILANISTAGSIGSVDIKDSVILLNSTAVGLGAKAISSSTPIDYRFFSDIISNGAFDGTNLISSTIGIVEPNAKSD